MITQKTEQLETIIRRALMRLEGPVEKCLWHKTYDNPRTQTQTNLPYCGRCRGYNSYCPKFIEESYIKKYKE